MKNRKIMQSVDAEINAVGGDALSDEAMQLYVKAAGLMSDLEITLKKLSELNETDVTVFFQGHDYLEGMHDVSTFNDFGPFYSVDKLESDERFAAMEKFNQEAKELLGDD